MVHIMLHGFNGLVFVMYMKENNNWEILTNLSL